MFEANKEIAQFLTTIPVKGESETTGDGHSPTSLDAHIRSRRDDASDYICDSELCVASYVSGQRTDVWAAKGKDVISTQMTSAADIPCFDDPNWTVQSVIGGIRSRWTGKYNPHLGIRVRYRGNDSLTDAVFKRMAEDRASDILASRKWRDVASSVADADDMSTLGKAAETLKTLDSAVSEIQSDLRAKDRSSSLDTLKTFGTGAVAGAAIAALASSALKAAKAWSQ